MTFIDYSLSSPHIVIIGAKLTVENNSPSEEPGSFQKGEMSLKADLLEILDVCLNHEERVSHVERRCEDNHQHIRSHLYTGYFYFTVLFRYLVETAEERAEESKRTKEESEEERSEWTGDDAGTCRAEMERLDQNCNVSAVGKMSQEGGGSDSNPVALQSSAVPREELNHQLVLTLSSSGKSVMWKGSCSCLGQFLYHGDHNNAPAYHQRHTVKGTKSRYLYKSTDGSWIISSELGSRGGQMRSTSKTPSVPTSDWYGVSDGQWVHDPGVRVTPGISPSCKSIIVIFRGEINANVCVYNDCVGVYVPTSQWSHGCPVYKHTHMPLYLSKFNGWTINSYPGTGAVHLENTVGALCPADQRGCWMDPLMGSPDFTVQLQCDVHDSQ